MTNSRSYSSDTGWGKNFSRTEQALTYRVFQMFMRACSHEVKGIADGRPITDVHLKREIVTISFLQSNIESSLFKAYVCSIQMSLVTQLS